MERRRTIVGLMLTALITLSFPMNSMAADDLEKNELDSIYSEIHEECKELTPDMILDDYGAYAYIINNTASIHLVDGRLCPNESFGEELGFSERVYLERFIYRINTLCEMGAIIIDDEYEIHVKDAPQQELMYQPRAAVIEIMPEARRHAAELRAVYNNAPFGLSHYQAGIYFKDRVKTKGIWDYKQYLGVNTVYYEPELRANMSGETIGNFHYGYVGSTCFGPTTLKSAAGLVQILSGTSELKYYNSYFDDPRDQSNIQWGINVYNSGR